MLGRSTHELAFEVAYLTYESIMYASTFSPFPASPAERERERERERENVM